MGAAGAFGFGTITVQGSVWVVVEKGCLCDRTAGSCLLDAHLERIVMDRGPSFLDAAAIIALGW